MYIDIDRFSGEAKEPETAFYCDNYTCKTAQIRVGSPYIDDTEQKDGLKHTGRRFCIDCGRLYGKNGTMRYAEARE